MPDRWDTDRWISTCPQSSVWGAKDPIFTRNGGRAFPRDLNNAELHMLDTRHFALEDSCDEIATLVRSFTTAALP